MADNRSFGRRGSTPVVARQRTASAETTPTPASGTPLDWIIRSPWRLIGLGIMACLLAVYLTQPEPIKDIAKWAALAVGLAAGALNLRLARDATLKRAQEMREAARERG